MHTSIKDIYKKFTKHFQDLTKNVLDPMVEFVRWCPYLELKPLKFLHKEI